MTSQRIYGRIKQAIEMDADHPWIDFPSKEFGGRSARQCIEMGNYWPISQFLDRIESDYLIYEHGSDEVAFLNGGITAQRYRVSIGAGDDAIEKLAGQTIPLRQESADGVCVGWGGGKHEFDNVLTFHKNKRGEFYQWSMIVEQTVLPAAKIKALLAVELEALEKVNSRKPNGKEKRAAKESIIEQFEQEAKDGRYTQRKLIPIVLDTKTNQIWLSSLSTTNQVRFESLFAETFGVGPEVITAKNTVDIKGLHTEMARFTKGNPSQPAWIAGEELGDGVGNEFLLWVLWHSKHVSDTLDNGITLMNAKSLELDCPNNVNGHDKFSHDNPISLAEVKNALVTGKLPRSAGFIAVHNEEQYEFTLKAEQWAITGGKCKAECDYPKGSPQAEVFRLEQCRAMFELVDLLMEQFIDLRGSEHWYGELKKIQQWLSGEEK